MDWIDANQLGRRNLSPDAFKLLLGRRYNRAKKQGERKDLTSGQSDTKLQTADRLAAQHGVSPATVASEKSERTYTYIAAGFLEYEREQARLRQSALNGKSQLVETFPQAGDAGKARDKAGERIGVSGREPMTGHP